MRGSSSIGDVIAGAITPKPLRKKLVDARKSIEKETRRISRISSKVEAREKKLFERIVELKESGNDEAARRMSAELSEVKKLEDTLRKSQALLEALALKLEGTVGLGDSIAALVEAGKLLNGLSSTISKLMPTAERSIEEVGATLNAALDTLSSITPPALEDTTGIIEEAARVAEKREKQLSSA